MKSPEKIKSENPDKELEEQKEREYRDTLEIVEVLHQMSLVGDKDTEKIKELYRAINLGLLQDHLLERDNIIDERDTNPKYKISSSFFDTLPSVNKLARIFENFRSYKYDSGSIFTNYETQNLSEDATSLLYNALLEVDEEILSQLDETKIKNFFESLKLLLTSTTDFYIEEVVNFLNRNKELLKKLSEDKDLPDIQHQIEELQNFMKTREFEQILISAVQNGIYTRRQTNKGGQKIEIQYCGELLKEVLAKYGFEPNEILDVWNGSYTEYGFVPHIEENIDTVFNIEDKRDGIARLLYREFGIRNFERYPESILIAQFDEFKNTEKPYGVMIQATHDSNGAFSSWSQRDVWKRMFDQIKEQYAFRIIEVKSKKEVARRLIELDQKYGENQKISFAFIGGHGTENSIMLGGTHRNNMLLSEDLTGRGVQRTGNFFKPHPTVVLISCSTGAESGIGQELSKVLGAKIIAPNIPTNLKNIEVFLNGEGIDFKVEYETKDQNQDIGRVYSGGENMDN